MRFVQLDPDTFRAARTAAGLSRQDIARLTGKTHVARRIEELGKPIREDTFRELAELLDLDDPLDPLPAREQWTHVGEFIARTRAARGWTQIDLAYRAGYGSEDELRAIETGRRVTARHLTSFRDALDLPVDFHTAELPPAVESLSVQAGRAGAGNAIRHLAVSIPGDLVQAERTRRGMTRIEFAALVGISHKTISRIERTSRGSEEAFLKLRDVVDLPDVELSPAAEKRVTIGRHIRAERHRRLMTVKQLGYRAGLSHLAIYYAETGQVLTNSVLNALRRVIDLPDEFDDIDPVPSQRPVPADRVPRIVPSLDLDGAALAKTWFENPPCADAPAGLFDPLGDDELPAAAWVRLNAAHRDYCSTCPFARECRQAAVTHCLQGIWGSALFRVYERAWTGRGRPGPPNGATGRDEHRMLAEIVPIDVHIPDDEPLCATCGSSYRRVRRNHRFCSRRCYSQHKTMRRQAQRAGVSVAGYGPNQFDRSAGPTRRRTEPGNAPSSFEDFKRNISLSSLQLRGH